MAKNNHNHKRRVHHNGSTQQEHLQDEPPQEEQDDPLDNRLDRWTVSLGVVLSMLFGLLLGQLRELWLETTRATTTNNDMTTIPQHYDGRGVARISFNDNNAAQEETVKSFVNRNEPFVCRACLPPESLGGWWDNDDNLLQYMDSDSVLTVRVAKRNSGDVTQFQRTTAPSSSGSGSAYREVNMTVANFFATYQDSSFQEHLYLAQVNVASSLTKLIPYVQASAPNETLLNAVGPMPPLSQRPLSMYLGTGLRTTQTHYDSLENVVCVVSGGTKTFELYDPMTSSLLLYVDRSQHGNGSPVLNDKKYPLFRYALPSTVTLQKGDCLYLPVYWYHAVTSSEERTVSINYWRMPSHDKMKVLERLFCDGSPAKAKC